MCLSRKILYKQYFIAFLLKLVFTGGFKIKILLLNFNVFGDPLKKIYINILYIFIYYGGQIKQANYSF